MREQCSVVESHPLQDVWADDAQLRPELMYENLPCVAVDRVAGAEARGFVMRVRLECRVDGFVQASPEGRHQLVIAPACVGFLRRARRATRSKQPRGAARSHEVRE